MDKACEQNNKTNLGNWEGKLAVQILERAKREEESEKKVLLNLQIIGKNM